MKLFGSIAELVATVFRKNSQSITLRPNQTTTYSASRDIQLPEQDANSILVSRNSSDVLTNKSIDGSTNTLSNVNLTTQVTGILPGANGGTGVNNTGRTVTLGGNVTTGGALSTAGSFTTIGAFNTQLTSTAATAVTLPTTGTLSTLIGVENLQNKSLDDTTTNFVDTSDNTKKIKFDAGGTTSTSTTLAAAQTSNQVLTLPDATDTLVGKATSDIFTNKTFDANGTGNSISNIENADIAAAAAIAYSKLALSNSIVNADVNTAAAIAYSKLALSNSILNADINTAAAIAYSKLNLATSIVNADIAVAANIDATKLATGVVDNTEFNRLNTVGVNATGEIVSTDGTQTLSNKTLAAADATTHLRLLNQAQLKLRETTGGGTDEISIQAPATLAASYTLTLPVDDGNSGEALTTNGTGTLSWSAVATDALNQYNVKVGNISNVATAVNTDTTGDIQADSTNGLSINQIVTIDTTQISSKTIVSGSTVTYPRMTVDTGHTWTFNSGSHLYVFDKLILNGTLVMNGDSVVTNMGLS